MMILMYHLFNTQIHKYKQGVVTDVKFSAEGDILATASKDKTVRLWTPSARGESVVLKGHTGAVRSADFSHDTRNLITASDDKTVKVSPVTPICLSIATTTLDPAHALTRCMWLLLLLQIWSLPTRRFVCSMVGHSNWVRSAQFSTDSSLAASCSDDRSVKLWDVAAHTNLHTFYDHQECVCLAFVCSCVCCIFR
jgi:centriolar protein POC1